jgi:hypothetical protein
MKKIINLTYNDLHDIVRECVYRIYTKLPLYEYAVHRSDFVYRVSNLLPQIIENWCLIRFCTLSRRTQTKEHWKDELRAHMLNIGGLDIKGNNKVDKRLKAIYEGFNMRDLIGECSDRIFLYIEGKFNKENIDINNNIVKQVVVDCNKALKDIALAMAQPMTIREYIDSI